MSRNGRRCDNEFDDESGKSAGLKAPHAFTRKKRRKGFALLIIVSFRDNPHTYAHVDISMHVHICMHICIYICIYTYIFKNAISLAYIS